MALQGRQPYNTADAPRYFPPLGNTSLGVNCSIGGRVTRGASPRSPGAFLPERNNAIRTVTFANGQPVVESPIPAGAVGQPVAFGEDVFGELYVASLTGTVYRIVGAGDTPPSQVTTLSNQCLHAPGTSLAGGTKLAAWPCNGSAAQRWGCAPGSLIKRPPRLRDVPNTRRHRPGAVQRISVHGPPAQRFARPPPTSCAASAACAWTSPRRCAPCQMYNATQRPGLVLRAGPAARALSTSTTGERLEHAAPRNRASPHGVVRESQPSHEPASLAI